MLLVIEDGKTQTLTLENDWSLKGATESIKRISLIYKNFYSDLGIRSLERSATVVDKSSSNSEVDFKELFIEFRAFCPSASEETWNKSYVPVLRIAQELLERSQKKPQNGEELMTYSLKKWEMGSRSRQIARRANGHTSQSCHAKTMRKPCESHAKTMRNTRGARRRKNKGRYGEEQVGTSRNFAMRKACGNHAKHQRRTNRKNEARYEENTKTSETGCSPVILKRHVKPR